jgi:hypothetical protein
VERRRGSERAEVLNASRGFASRPWAIVLALVGLVYLALFVGSGFLRGAPRGDEVHLWPTALSFSQSWFPTPGQLRDYPELSTPLPFVAFGWLEHVFVGGIVAGRALNLALSLGMTWIVVCGIRPLRQAIAIATGLFAFPYYLGLATLLYTDVIGAAFVIAGLILCLQTRPLRAAGCFTLAIACRQFEVAFPLAIAGYELFRGDRSAKADMGRWVWPLLSGATLAWWYWLFRGPAPAGAMAALGIDGVWPPHVRPSHAVYLLSCVGAFYVIPEFILFPGARRAWKPSRRLALVVASTLVVAFVFPPLGNSWGTPTMGVFDRTVASVLGPLPRTILYGVLASLATARFSEWALPTFLVTANAAVLVVAPVMWEKYALALFICLWYLKARETTDELAVTPGWLRGQPVETYL